MTAHSCQILFLLREWPLKITNFDLVQKVTNEG
jgi:hypothetical protein